jgi:hypothetical protein
VEIESEIPMETMEYCTGVVERDKNEDIGIRAGSS